MGRRVDSANSAEVARSLRSDAHVPAHAIAEAPARGAASRLVDASNDADLDAIVAAGTGNPAAFFGPAQAASRRLVQGSGAAQRGLPVAPPAGSLTFCIGSDHPVTLQQIARLREAKPDAVVLPLGSSPIAALFRPLRRRYRPAVCTRGWSAAHRSTGEVLPGIPWGILRCGYHGTPVTKSGGFGDPDALIRVAEFFQ